MTVVFRADGVPVAERAEYWRHAIGQTLIPLEPIDVPDRLLASEVGALQVGELTRSLPRLQAWQQLVPASPHLGAAPHRHQRSL